jgi:uncharacterized protein (TIGR02996 family)
MNEQAFLQAIKDRPDDDDLLLVYADWLEERGDQRAEFLRFLGSIAGGGVLSEQPVPSYRQIQSAEARLRRLWKTVARDWAEQVIQLRSAAPLRFRFWAVSYGGGRLDPLDTTLHGVIEAGAAVVHEKVKLPTESGKVVRAGIDLITGYKGMTGFSTPRHVAGQIPLLLNLRFASYADWIRVPAPGLILQDSD